MKKVKKYILGILVGVLVFVIYPYYKDYQKLKRDRKIAPVLTETEKDKFIIDREGNTRHVTKDKDGNQKVKEVDGARDTVITIDNDGNVDMWYRTKGLIFEPGITSFLSDGFLHVGIDTQWFYYRRWGVGSGVGLAINKDYKFGLYTGVYYNFWSNTSLHIGFNEDLNVAGGIRIKF